MDRDIMMAFVAAVELKDETTAAHTWRVTLYAMALAEAAGLDQELIRRIRIGAVLHDIGKIDIPQKILTKPGKLTDAEFAIIKTHTTLGYDRLLRMEEDDELILAMVRSHHERVDGTGYPDGLAGEAIPLPARFFAVIDTFDAMTSLRPYRQETGSKAAEIALAELAKHAGTWYCKEAVEQFTRLYESGTIDWVLEYFNRPHDLDEHVVIPDVQEKLGKHRAAPLIETLRRAADAAYDHDRSHG